MKNLISCLYEFLKCKNIYRGYFPVVDGEPSHKEGFECARDVPPGDTSVSPKNWFYEKSVWPDEDTNILESMHNFLAKFATMGLRL
jgi:isopenicillin N synthase-like dioxygenase